MLPKPPKEVAVIRSADVLAPKFRDALARAFVRLRAQGYTPRIEETLRTDERQRFLYGFGRDYDDGRGVVTKAANVAHTWHGYALAADCIDANTEWDNPKFFTALGVAAKAEGLEWAGDWHEPDRPHVQWGNLKDSPSERAVELKASGGVEAVWREVHAE